MSDAGRRASGGRAQSEVLGFVLMLTMVLLGVGVVLVVGQAGLADTQNTLDNQRAEKVMTQLDSKAALVGLGDSRVQRVDLSRTQDSTYHVREDRGWMRVNVTNTTAGTTETVVNVTLGAVVYENDGTTLAYQGGGVWRTDGNGSVMVSPPEFHYRSETLTLPLISVGGDATVDGTATIRSDAPINQTYPNSSLDPNYTNPLDDARVRVTVQSEYYEAWATFFEERTDGEAIVDHENETATLLLVARSGNRRITSAVAATSTAGGELRLAGSGAAPAYTDSYVSPGYAGGQDNGTIVTASDITVTGNGQVHGNISSGGTVDLASGSCDVFADIVEYTDSNISGCNYNGEWRQINGIASVSPINSWVNGNVDRIANANANGSEADIDDGELDFTSGDDTLESGSYYLDRMVVDQETLRLDTSGGNIEIAVDDYVQVTGSGGNPGEIIIEGNNEVSIYVRGSSSFSCHSMNTQLCVHGGRVVHENTTRNATQFWVYGHSDFDTQMRQTASINNFFVGVVYAPAGETGSGEYHSMHAEHWGAVVTGSAELDNGGKIHYDERLNGTQAVPPDSSIIPITYLHISQNQVNVTSG